MKIDELSISPRMLVTEASQRGMEYEAIDQMTVLMKSKGQQFYIRGSRTSWQSSIGREFSNDKFLMKKILAYHGLPTAKAVRIKGQVDIKEMLKEMTFPLVMKPVYGAHGKGVFVGLADVDECVKAYQASDEAEVLFEEMLRGEEYRVVCVDFKFVAACQRVSAHVRGDGKSTIGDLIEEKNKHPWRGEDHSSPLTKIILDEEVQRVLTEKKLTVESVPEEGQMVWLRKTANLSGGGEAWNVSDRVSQENKELFERIARVCDLNTLGIDVMCSSLSDPIVGQSQAGVIEINGSPGLRMHHFPVVGEPVNVASKIIDLVEKNL